VTGAWEVQDHLDRLADAADNPRGLERGLATMSAVAEQRTKLQVPPQRSIVGSNGLSSCIPSLHVHCMSLVNALAHCHLY